VDTLRTARNVDGKGFIREQAKAVADAIGDTGLIVVKRDIDVLKWMVGAVIVVVVAVFWQLFSLSSAVTRLDERVAAFGDRMGRVEGQLGSVVQHLTSVEQQVASAEQAVRAVAESVSGVESRLPPRP
jgi:hypothetical protein